MIPKSTVLTLLLMLAASPLAGAPPQKIIFDTDFVLPPQDDGLALIFTLNCPELQIQGITTVAGNKNLERATVDVLKLLEIAGRTEIPVFRGANRPLVHEKDDFAARSYGGWWSDEPAPEPPGGFAKKKAESRSALDFIIGTVMQNPGQVTILALGPLTNIAAAIRMEPGFAGNVKQLVIMGGAIASLPDGGGNLTPNAEFNFWVDPEAARVVLRSGIPTILSPLNVSRKSRFTKEWYEKIVAVDTPLTRLIKERMGPGFQKNPDRAGFMYDQIAAATLIDPAIAKTTELYVDVDINHGLNYGVSVGGRQPWPGAEGSRKIVVQHELDWDRFIRLYVERVTRPAAAQAGR